MLVRIGIAGAIAINVMLAALALYLRTACPTLGGGWDSEEFQYVAYTLGIAHSTAAAKYTRTGAVIGTATSNGVPIALTRERWASITLWLDAWVIDTLPWDEASLAERQALFERLAEELTEKAARLGTCDYATEIAYFMPATVILHLLGLPLAHLEKVREWNRGIQLALSTTCGWDCGQVRTRARRRR